MKTILLIPFLFITTGALGIKTVWDREEVKGDKKVTIQVVNGVHERISGVEIRKRKFRVLFPGLRPTIVTDGNEYFELGDNLELQSQFRVDKDGVLRQRAMDSEEETSVGDVSTNAQISHHLLSLSPKDRPGDLLGNEQYLLKQVKDNERPILPVGIEAGAILLQGRNQYLILGNERYPDLVTDNEFLYYYDRKANDLFPLLVSAEKKIKLGNSEISGNAPPPLYKSTSQGAMLYFADNFDGFEPSVKKVATEHFRALLPKGARSLVVDFKTGTLPSEVGRSQLVDENGKVLNARSAQERALNYLLNFIGKNQDPQSANLKLEKGGKATKETFDVEPFLDPQQVAKLYALNPYACQDRLTTPLRVDWLMSVIQKDATYRSLAGIPPTLAELEAQLGVNTTLQPHADSNQNVGIETSGVAVSIRALNRQPQTKQKGLPFYQSFDFAVGRDGKLTNQKAEFSRFPTSFKHNVGEFIYLKPNGFQAFAIYDADRNVGKQLSAASDLLVNDSETKFGPFVHNPRSCMECHISGMRSPQDQTPSPPESWRLNREQFEKDEAVKEQFGNYAKYQAAVNTYFGDISGYMKAAEEDSKKVKKALIQSASYAALEKKENAVSLPGLFYRSYQGNVPLAQAAKELGVPLESLRKYLNRVGGRFTVDEMVASGKKQTVTVEFNRAEGHFSRNDFERVFCQLKTALAEGEGASRPVPTVSPKSHGAAPIISK